MLNYCDITGILVPIITIIYILENSALRSMVAKEKLEKFTALRAIDDAVCLTILSFILCDIIDFISNTEFHIWIYSIVGMIVGIIIAITIIYTITKYLKKRIEKNEPI